MVRAMAPLGAIWESRQNPVIENWRKNGNRGFLAAWDDNGNGCKMYALFKNAHDFYDNLEERLCLPCSGFQIIPSLTPCKFHILFHFTFSKSLNTLTIKNREKK